ncbi:hypothetical protein DFH07DRAFT_780703 [Mycena maculata]|uniref:Uncharacterized protein n=1 Tax=Mycena maculata TaxID=230809 RepID=A0AAD7MU35_9AGAR|nr:hypothetical protein DFH07DRAFT_780703 [Mycena maculata]
MSKIGVPPLLPELEREILELMALSWPECIPQILAVSRRARICTANLLKGFSACTGTVDLVVREEVDPTLLPLLGALPLQHLVADLTDFLPTPPIDFRHPMFSQITHLELSDALDRDSYVGLAQMPWLTHLALDMHRPVDIYQNSLRHCKFLKVLLLVELSNDQQQDWTVAARGGKDHWILAEERVAAKAAAR